MTRPTEVWQNDPTYNMLHFFSYEHLPQGPMQETSKKIYEVALYMYCTVKPGPEKTAGMRKLLEAKDCLVRAVMG